jgi:hypothetical protein
VDVFALFLVAAVPVLYALFWWLDYRWLAESREQELAPPPPDDDEDDGW